MQPDDELCLCFHVTQRKVLNFLRVEKPRRVQQLSECFGAGTGCGWCRPFLRKLFEQANQGAVSGVEIPDAAAYANQRTQYVLEGHGSPPPGATPILGGAPATPSAEQSETPAVDPSAAKGERLNPNS